MNFQVILACFLAVSLARKVDVEKEGTKSHQFSSAPPSYIPDKHHAGDDLSVTSMMHKRGGCHRCCICWYCCHCRYGKSEYPGASSMQDQNLPFPSGDILDENVTTTLNPGDISSIIRFLNELLKHSKTNTNASTHTKPSEGSANPL